jgi:TatD DNase family protein
MQNTQTNLHTNLHIQMVDEFLKKNSQNYMIDSHCHIHFEGFDSDIDEVISNASSHNVTKMITVGTEKDSHEKIIPIVEKYENVYGTIGIHPCSTYSIYTDNNDENKSSKNTIYDYLTSFANHPKIVGFGETGLDFYVNPMRSTPIQQEESFRQHIAAGKNFDMPLVIHTRNAEEDTIRILNSENFSNAVLHCFTSSQWLADKGLEIGLYISFSGIITFKNSHELRDVVKNTPLDRILIETDAPYLSPEPVRKIQRNQSSHVIYTAGKIAEIHGITIEEVIEQTTKNCLKVFNKMNK